MSFEPKRNPLKYPELYAKLNPLFDSQWKEIKKDYKDNTKPKTTEILKPLRKKQRVSIKLTKDEKLKICIYILCVLKRFGFFLLFYKKSN